MRRVLVLGCPGSGKTTFSCRLAARTGLPIISLDREHWRPGWVPLPRQVWRARVAELCARPCWIMDGNYDSSLDLRLPHADTVVIFDRGLALCLARVTWRACTGLGQVRPEMAPGCPERFDLGFYRYIWNFSRRDRPNVDRMLAVYGRHLSPVIFRRDADVARFLDSLPCNHTAPG